MDKKAREEVLQELATIRELARKVRGSSGIPLVESCARWCETYAQMALWSLGEGERFEFLADQRQTGHPGGEPSPIHPVFLALRDYGGGEP